MSHPPVLSIGELLIDLIADDDAADLEHVSTFVARPGGAPANVAVGLARLGVASAFCGVIGDDPFGARVRATLAAERVDGSRLRETIEADTTLAFAWKNASGDGRFRLLRMADRLLDRGDVENAGIDQVAAIVVGSVALAAEPSRSAVVRAVDIAAHHEIPVCFDVNARPTLWPDAETARSASAPVLARSTLLKFSLDDARFLLETGHDPEDALVQILALGAEFSVLTDGARGAWYSAVPLAHIDCHVPAFAVHPKDPTGAGDAFTAALIARLIDNGWDSMSRSDIEYASAAGALTSSRVGAMEALPTAAEVDAFLAVHQATEHR